MYNSRALPLLGITLFYSRPPGEIHNRYHSCPTSVMAFSPWQLIGLRVFSVDICLESSLCSDHKTDLSPLIRLGLSLWQLNWNDQLHAQQFVETSMAFNSKIEIWVGVSHSVPWYTILKECQQANFTNLKMYILIFQWSENYEAEVKGMEIAGQTFLWWRCSTSLAPLNK